MSPGATGEPTSRVRSSDGVHLRQPGQVRLHGLDSASARAWSSSSGVIVPWPRDCHAAEDRLEQLVVQAAALERREPVVVVTLLGQPQHVARVELERALRVELERAHRARRVAPAGRRRREIAAAAATGGSRAAAAPVPSASGGVRAATVGEQAEPAKGDGASAPARPISSSRLDRLHQRVVFEREGGDRDVARRRLQQVDEGRREAGRASRRRRRPAERCQQARGIEDVAARAARPLAVDQADQMQGVEAAKWRGGGVDQLHAVGAGIGREGLGLRCDAAGRRSGRRASTADRDARDGPRRAPSGSRARPAARGAAARATDRRWQPGSGATRRTAAGDRAARSRAPACPAV